MDFERQDVPPTSNADSLKKELTLLVQSELSKEEINANTIYSKIKEKIGAENADDAMLNFAINTAMSKITKAKKAAVVLPKAEFKKQVDLVVGWALIKIKGKDESEIGELGKNNTNDQGYGTGGDLIVLKDFKIK